MAPLYTRAITVRKSPGLSESISAHLRKPVPPNSQSVTKSSRDASALLEIKFRVNTSNRSTISKSLGQVSAPEAPR